METSPSASSPSASSRWLLLLAAIVVTGLVGGGAYYGFTEMETLRQEAAHCGAPGCERLASDHRNLQAEMEEGLNGKVSGLETEIRDLKQALEKATAERDRLSQQVAACGEGGCEALREELETAKGEQARLGEQVAALEKARTELRDQMAALEKTNAELQAQLGAELAQQKQAKVHLAELLRIGPFDLGSFKLDDAKVAEIEAVLSPYKGTPLLVIGIADKSPYKGASAELKQLGLMLARARLVKEMGYEVYYQIRQNDPSVPQSRGLVVYKFSLEEAQPSVAQADKVSLPVPTFFTSTGSQAG